MKLYFLYTLEYVSNSKKNCKYMSGTQKKKLSFPVKKKGEFANVDRPDMIKSDRSGPMVFNGPYIFLVKIYPHNGKRSGLESQC